MNDSRTILVPIDFSDCTSNVVEQAAERARQEGAELVLLHVTQTPEGLNETTLLHPRGAASGVTVDALLRDEAAGLMQRHVEEARERGIQARSRIEQGQPDEVIVRVAEELRAIRIVMGTHGRKGLSRLVLGSVAQRVKRRASCQVEMIRTVHKEHCEARSCSWCATHRTPAERQALAELDG